MRLYSSAMERPRGAKAGPWATSTCALGSGDRNLEALAASWQGPSLGRLFASDLKRATGSAASSLPVLESSLSSTTVCERYPSEPGKAALGTRSMRPTVNDTMPGASAGGIWRLREERASRTSPSGSTLGSRIWEKGRTPSSSPWRQHPSSPRRAVGDPPRARLRSPTVPGAGLSGRDQGWEMEMPVSGSARVARRLNPLKRQRRTRWTSTSNTMRKRASTTP